MEKGSNSPVGGEKNFIMFIMAKTIILGRYTAGLCQLWRHITMSMVLRQEEILEEGGEKKITTTKLERCIKNFSDLTKFRFAFSTGF